MKKKLLSLVLAGAMVASTSVSAFAEGVQTPSQGTVSQTPSTATGKQEVNVTNTAGNAEIEIEGKIADNNNQLPPSTISVTVPTNASFTVDKDGKLIGANINITSQGDAEVEVLAYKFKDISGDSDIKVLNSAELKTENDKGTNADRRNISLSLEGNENKVSLITATSSNTSGICKFNTSVEPTSDEDKKLGTVNSNKPLTLKLEGKGVTNSEAPVLTDPVKDRFTLTLKLKKINS